MRANAAGLTPGSRLSAELGKSLEKKDAALAAALSEAASRGAETAADGGQAAEAAAALRDAHEQLSELQVGCGPWRRWLWVSGLAGDS